jgi:hypothetical protein
MTSTDIQPLDPHWHIEYERLLGILRDAQARAGRTQDGHAVRALADTITLAIAAWQQAHDSPGPSGSPC